MGRKLDFALAVLNGAVGDYLARTDNPLATGMSFVAGGEPFPPSQVALARALGEPKRRVAIFVHGLMCTETVWEHVDGTDVCTRLARDLEISTLAVRYNSGRAIADNGVALDGLLTELVRNYPVAIDELILIGFSMGGLVIRSACHAASLGVESRESLWLPLVRRAIYVGTPHLGAPLERVGRVVAKVLEAVDDPYTRLIADVANLRSEGLKDLGDADLRHEDRASVVGRITLRDPRHPVPLLASMQHYLVAGSLSPDPTLAMLFGDSIVPVRSATDGACIDRASLAIPPTHVKLIPGVPHIGLPRHTSVYESIRDWCKEAA